MNVMRIEKEEELAINTISTLFGEFCSLINANEDKIDYYIEEMAKQGLTLKEVVKKVDLWMKKEKNQNAKRAKEQK